MVGAAVLVIVYYVVVGLGVVVIYYVVVADGVVVDT